MGTGRVLSFSGFCSLESSPLANSSSMGSRASEVIVPLYSSGDTAVLCPALGTGTEEAHGAVGASPEEATKMI